MRLLTAIKQKYYDTFLANLWHKAAPSFAVKKTFFGQTVFMDFRDNIDEISHSTKELESREREIMEIPLHVEGSLWDVGANVGLFSVRVASAGHACVAFEFSIKAASLLQRTVQTNSLPITIVNRAFSTTPKHYDPAETAGTENHVLFSEAGREVSMTYLEAETVYGTPSFIKMDIEGGENEFFDSTDFKAWIIEKEICWLVELHPARLGYLPGWEDVARVEVDVMHHLYCVNREKLNRLMDKLRK